jgi:hypothetical protein
MMLSKPAPKNRLLFSLLLGIATLGTTLGTAEQASALPLLEGLVAPLGSLLGGQHRPPTPNDTQVMNGNLNNNSLNLCALTCGPSAGASGLPGAPAPAGIRPPGLPGSPVGMQMVPGGQMMPGGQMIPGRPVMPNGQMIPGRSPYPVPPQGVQAQRSQNPILQLPPIQLPNPF